MLVRGGGFVSYIWEFIVVICAGMALVTNMIVIVSMNELDNELVQLTREVTEQEMRVEMLNNRLDGFEAECDELSAQLRYGLADRYEIQEK